MGGQQGYSKVTTNNLIFAYDTGDKINSYKGRPTDNLIANAGISIYNNVGGDVSITLTQTSDSYKGASIWKEVITPTTSTGVSYLTNGNNPGIGVYHTGGGGIANRYAGHTIFFKPEGPMFSSPIFTQYSNIAGWQSTNQYEDMGDGWFRAKVLWYDTVTRTDGKFWAINPSGATINAPITIYWAGPFKEDLNSTTISQFINGTRSVTQGLINLSNPAVTLDLTDMSYDSNVQMYFDATNDYINTPLSAQTISNVTIEAIVYDTRNNGGYRAIVQNNLNSDDALYIYPNNTLGFWPCGGGSLTVPANQWNHVVASYDGGSIIYSVNGVFQTVNTVCSDITNWEFLRIGAHGVGDGERWGGQISVVKVYNRALTQAEITQNYNHYKTRFSLT